VLVVDSMVPDYGGNLHNPADVRDRLQVKFADVRDVNAMNYLVQGQDVVFNLAGQVSHIDSMRDPCTDLEINCRSQLSLLEACRWHNPTAKVVFASTRQVYGRPDRTPVDETHVARPTDVNGINKLAGESYHIVYNNAYGVRANALRLTNTYGPRQLMKHNRQGFLPWFIRLVLDDEETQLFGDGSQERDFTYVDDAVDAFLLAGCTANTDGKIYNLGGECASLREVVELLIELAGRGRYAMRTPSERNRAFGASGPEVPGGKLDKGITWRISRVSSPTITRSISSCKMAWRSSKLASLNRVRIRSQKVVSSVSTACPRARSCRSCTCCSRWATRARRCCSSSGRRWASSAKERTPAWYASSSRLSSRPKRWRRTASCCASACSCWSPARLSSVKRWNWASSWPGSLSRPVRWCQTAVSSSSALTARCGQRSGRARRMGSFPAQR